MEIVSMFASAIMALMHLLGIGHDHPHPHEEPASLSAGEIFTQSDNTVEPSVPVPAAAGVEYEDENVKIYTDEQYRYIVSNSLPNHETGQFPNRGNPNTISEQELSFRVTLMPEYTGGQVRVQQPGVALNGVAMEPGTAEREGNFNIEALQDTYNLGLDDSNAHVQPNGQYHYHGIPLGFIDGLETTADVVHVGWAADGFPMYVSQSGAYTPGWELIGTRSDGTVADGTFTQDFAFTGTGDLDECNGIELQGKYVYFLTDTFPYIPRCLNGIPDESFNKNGGAPGTNGVEGRPAGPDSRPPVGGQPPRQRE